MRTFGMRSGMSMKVIKILKIKSCCRGSQKLDPDQKSGKSVWFAKIRSGLKSPEGGACGSQKLDPGKKAQKLGCRWRYH